jgi:hypothetical protein
MQPNTQLDPQVLNLAKAIRRAETGSSSDPYNAKGASGETGAYQFMPETWKQWSGQYLGDANAPLSVENQNKVAYSRIKELKDQGYNPAQIASLWNSGKADAYKQDYRGVNKHGVEYNVPEYVKKVSQIYNEIKMGNQMPNQAPTGGTYLPPPTPTPFVPSEPPAPEEEKGIGRKAAEFLFPILEDKERTGLQTAADLGLSALTLVPGLGAAKVGAQAAVQGGKGVLKSLLPKVFSKSTIAKGGIGGYGFDVLSNVSEGETGAGALTPGMGTALGIGAPLLARGFKGTAPVQRALDDEALKTASELVSPTLTKSNIKKGLKRGEVAKSGGLKGEIDLGLDTRRQRAAESIKDLVKDGAIKSTDTVERKVGVIRAEIADTAEELEQQLKNMDVVPIVQPEELENLLKKTEQIFKESPALVGDAGSSAKRIYKKFVSFIPTGKDVTALDILRARKKLDRWIESEGRVGVFDPKLETAISKSLREIRQGANELLAQKAPNVQVQEMLRKQASMYDAMDGIIENEWRDVGTTRTGRYFKRHPYQKEAIRGALTAAGTGIVGGGIAGAFLGDKLTN